MAPAGNGASSSSRVPGALPAGATAHGAFIRLPVVQFLPVDKTDHIRIGLNLAGLAQIRQGGHMTGTALHRTRELRQRQHRTAQLLRERLQPA
jgi:hypothetical protein